MALSLQEQLLKSGLADKKKAGQIKREKHKKVKQAQKHKVVEQDANKLAADKAREEKRQRDLALNQKQKQEAEKKAQQAQIKQLIEMNQQAKNNGDIRFNFTDGTLVKWVMVDALTQKRLSDGKLAIAKLEDNYQIVPVQVADKITERDETVVVYRGDIAQPDAQSSDDDDWYADFEVPDDLMW